jgi:molybdopterin-binding protein
MRISARNQLPARATKVTLGAVMASENLDLEEGDQVTVIIKATEVLLESTGPTPSVT